VRPNATCALASLPVLLKNRNVHTLHEGYSSACKKTLGIYMLDATSRVAFAALLHDLGKLAERAKIEVRRDTLESNQQLYCPHHKEFVDARGWFSHLHAAYTGLAWDELEKTGHFPDLRSDCEPFKVPAGDNKFPDSAVNAAAAHHKPETFLQWVIATADRVASGFERDNFDTEYNNCRERNETDPPRDNHYRARLLTLFEQIDKGEIKEGDLKWRYPLKPLSPKSLFPQQDRANKFAPTKPVPVGANSLAQQKSSNKFESTKAVPVNANSVGANSVGANSFAQETTSNCTPDNDKDAQAEYKVLWDALLEGIKRIPKSHRDNLPLWLDHFDALWLTMTHAIPAATAFGVKPEVSLYDHSKATAALATALWRWHNAHQLETVDSLKNSWDEKKFLLVQGDFFGIQNFIFSEGGQTNKHAHKLLRGRSFQVALLAECAALKLLEALKLPPTSQIINAAGKFLIVAPNTKAAQQVVECVRMEFNDWCLQHTYGEIGIGLATTEASCNDFSRGNFGALQEKLFKELNKAKHRRFDLCDKSVPAIFAGFLDQFDNNLGVCEINGRYPADPDASKKRDYALCKLADDQIRIGEELTKKSRVLITRNVDSLPNLSLDYFGWRIAFVPVPEEDVSGKYGQLANDRKLIRCWDFDLPEADDSVFHGYARRFVNTFVPRFDEVDALYADKYGKWESEVEFDREHPIKTLHHIACEDRKLLENGKWQGEIALVTLKGDVDNLGALFQQGLEKPTFAKMASLSRQVNLFFALWLPWFCEHGKDDQGVARYRNTYTVFAGGDDFFLIGPWQSTIALAGEMQKHFATYVAKSDITFSAGMVMTQPKVPAKQLARSAEAALEKSKAYGVDANSVGANSVGANSFAQNIAKRNVTENRSNKSEPSKAEHTKNAATLWNQTVSWSDWHELMTVRAKKLQDLLDQAEEHGAPLSSGMVYSLLELADKAERDQSGNTNRKPEDSLWRSQLAYRTSRFITDRVRKKGDEDIKAIRCELFTKVNNELADALNKHRGSYRLPLSVLLYGKRE
jgi:CRISPR-associated protein Csm1